MEILTDRLLIRPVQPADLEAVQATREANLGRVGNRPRTLDETRDMIAAMAATEPGREPGWSQYAVVLRTAQAVIGDIGVNFGGPGERQAELGYSFQPDRWGQGYGSEAGAAMLSHLFDPAGHALHRVVAIAARDNARSRRLLERLGFRLEGETVESFFHHAQQRFVDEAVYALLAREWNAR